jgi:AcrR family transcriptional regulator
MSKQVRTRDTARQRRATKQTPRKTQNARAEELARVALDLFAERNFASVTIKDIARESGVNAALIYYYFESKEDLFRAVIEHAVDQAFENVRMLRERHQSPLDIIDDWLNNHVQLFEPIHKLVKISLDYSGAQTRVPSIDRSIRQFYDEEARMLSNCIRQGVAEGMFSPVDPEELALFISTYLDGLMVRSVILPDVDLAQYINYLRQHIWGMLGVTGDAGRQSSARPSVPVTA